MNTNLSGYHLMNRNSKAIVNQLKKHRGLFISGAAISENLGISRAAVWKHVSALRKDGYRITARPRCGYRLEQEPDRLDAEKLAVNGVDYYETVDSTNTVARRIAEGNSSGGKRVIVADRQTAGRGRRGRIWESPPGAGLWFSLLLKPRGIPPDSAAPVTLVCAVSLAECLRTETGIAVSVKWPNDLVINGKKVCGILTELKGEPDRLEYLVIGIGINVNQKEFDFPAELRSRVTSLRLESGRLFDRTSLFLRLRENLEQSCDQFFTDGFASFRRAWIDLNSTLGLPVTVTWGGGTLQGTAVGLDPGGALLIKDRYGELHRVGYGELTEDNPDKSCREDLL